MSRASYTFSVLQATAAVASLAIIMWSLGLPVLQFAEAANVTTLTDTLSDSAPGALSDHTIEFITPTGIGTGQTITVDFSDGPFVVGSVDFSDIDVQEGETDYVVAADCTGAVGDYVGADFSGTTLTIDFCAAGSANIAANGSTTIEIGLNAAGGDQQMTNPVAGSYQIPITAGASDTGETRVAIVDNVTVTATVDTIFTFDVAGFAGAVAGETAGPGASATAVPFGELSASISSTSAQQLSVTTNASNGFVVTVAVDQQLTSSNGSDIDGYIDGAFTTAPTAWSGPGETPGQENEYGHWGLSSTDTTLTSGLTDFYDDGGSRGYVSASTTPVEVFRNDGPTDGSGDGVGITEVLYRVEISELQEAADDYTATLTYVATPVF